MDYTKAACGGDNYGINSATLPTPRPEAWQIIGRLSKGVEALEDAINATEIRFAGVLEPYPKAESGPIGRELSTGSGAELAQVLAGLADRIEVASSRLATIRNQSVV